MYSGGKGNLRKGGLPHLRSESFLLPIMAIGIKETAPASPLNFPCRAEKESTRESDFTYDWCHSIPMLASLLLSSHVKYGFQEPRKVDRKYFLFACLLKYLLTCLLAC